MELTTTINKSDLLTVDEAAELLNVKPRFIRRLIAEERIPVHRLGRHVRLHRDDLMEYVAAGRREAARQARWPRTAAWK